MSIVNDVTVVSIIKLHIDIDSNVVQSRRLSCHLECLLVKLKGSCELSLFEQFISLVFVLSEGDFIELLLDQFEFLGSLSVLRLKDHNFVQICLALLIFLQSVVRIRSAKQKLDLQIVLLVK